MTTLEEVRDTFELIDDWTERYRFLIELGSELPPMPDALKTEETKVKGCLSQVWLVGTLEDGSLRLIADSDAHIVRGLVALVRMMFDGQTPETILETDPQPLLEELGLDKHLSPGRSNGLHSMLKRIRAIAEQAKS